MELTDERFTINYIPCSSDCLVDARVIGSLMITNASRSDIDMYTCTAMNILGEVNASLNLIVECKLLELFIYVAIALLSIKAQGLYICQYYYMDGILIISIK